MNKKLTALTLVTTNEHKSREFRNLLGRELQMASASLVEPQHWDVSVVAQSKAEQAWAELGRPVIVDDSALEVVEWEGLPGALVSWFIDRIGCEGILRMAETLDDRSAVAVTALGYCDAEGSKVAVGRVLGTLAKEASGHNGFGFDRIFIPVGQARTYATMLDADKEELSMRRRAVEELKRML